MGESNLHWELPGFSYVGIIKGNISKCRVGSESRHPYEANHEYAGGGACNGSKKANLRLHIRVTIHDSPSMSV